MGRLDHVSRGFLGTAAPLYADVVLLIEIAIALILLFGVWLARQKKFKWHAVCQSAMVLLNAVVILIVMLPAFNARVLPKLPAKFNRPYYLLSTTHAALGIASESVALYIVVAAGTKLLPERLRFKNYKLWMRITLAFWWMTLFFGLATYARWYIP